MKQISAINDSPRMRVLLLAATLVLSAVLAVALPYAVEGMSFYDSCAMMAVPLIALGVWDIVFRQRWLRLVVFSCASVLLLLLDWKVGAVAAMLTFGATGISAFSDLVQRRYLGTVLDSVEHCNVRRRTVTDRLISFLFNIPEDLDSRDMRMNPAVQREDLPWRAVVDMLIPALVPMIFLWMFASVSFGFRHDIVDSAIPTMTIVMYILALTLPWTVIRTMDLRVEGRGSVFRLYDGLTGTVVRMAVPSFICLVIVLFAASPGWNAAVLVLLSAIFCIALSISSMFAYMLDAEASLVSDVHSDWEESHPVDFYSAYDGRDGRHPLDDGVPGTPRRPADSCFSVQRKN